MAHTSLGNVLLIANPAAHSGAGAKGARFADRFFTNYKSVASSYTMKLTTKMGDAFALARKAARYDTVLALGGDGVIHETVCGLMTIPENMRPQLGILPIGSGNDFARTTGMIINDIEGAAGQLVRGHAEAFEVGRVVNEKGDVSYFMETLSFGLDAAIALDTTERRAHNTKAEGEALFITSGIKLLSRQLKGHKLRVRFGEDQNAPFEELKPVLFAIQVGPTYGGGFQVCPDADPTDGLLDCCYTVKTPSIPRALSLFALARAGKHVNSSIMNIKRFKHAELQFADEPPCQVDGEKFWGSQFTIDVIPGALKVILPYQAS